MKALLFVLGVLIVGCAEDKEGNEFYGNVLIYDCGIETTDYGRQVYWKLGDKTVQDLRGIIVYRSNTPDMDSRERITYSPLTPAHSSSFLDTSAALGETYYYWLALFTEEGFVHDVEVGACGP